MMDSASSGTFWALRINFIFHPLVGRFLNTLPLTIFFQLQYNKMLLLFVILPLRGQCFHRCDRCCRLLLFLKWSIFFFPHWSRAFEEKGYSAQGNQPLGNCAAAVIY